MKKTKSASQNPAASYIVAMLAVGVLSIPAAAQDCPPGVREVLETHCYDCHDGISAEAGLDLTELTGALGNEQEFSRWVRIYDRVDSREMPPPDMESLAPDDASEFVNSVGDWLRAAEQRRFAERGRVRGRRLTNLELERTLHDLLGIDIPLARLLPDEPRPHGFACVADGQPMSHFQLEGHLAVVDTALEEAFRRSLGPDKTWTRTFNASALSRRRPQSRTREPELIKTQAVTWSSRLIFYGRLPATTAQEDGWYRFVVRASALKSPAKHGVWCTVRSGRCVSSAPLLSWIGAFEATENPQQWTFEAWLPKGHMLEIRPGDTTLKMARFRGGQVGAGEGGPQQVPGVGIEWISMERFHRGQDDHQIQRMLFGDLKIDAAPGTQAAQVVSENPQQDATELIHRFARRAFRRPVSTEIVAPYVAMVHQAIDAGVDFASALRAGYRALLCSPRFLYFQENPGRLDHHAVACRLSYLICGSMPDKKLFRLAETEQLQDPDILRAQVERLLAKRGETQFVRDMAAEWLDLRLIDATEPNRRMYPNFDIIVQQSMLDETHAFLELMLRDDLSIDNLIRSDFTFLNSRLARYYGFDGVTGDRLRRVKVGSDTHRGGLISQGAVLKVTANGTATSPVVRGVWIAERLLGQTVPPPPAGVPAIEPDVRGAKTIREMLAKHRSDEACASCHKKIDPPGFALENFDAAGQWRSTYVRMSGGRRSAGAPIDSSYTLADGREFDNLQEFRELILAEPSGLARNMIEKLLVYGTGAQIAFSDRDVVSRIVRDAAQSGYGLRSLLHTVVASPIFLTK